MDISYHIPEQDALLHLNLHMLPRSDRDRLYRMLMNQEPETWFTVYGHIVTLTGNDNALVDRYYLYIHPDEITRNNPVNRQSILEQIITYATANGCSMVIFDDMVAPCWEHPFDINKPARIPELHHVIHLSNAHLTPNINTLMDIQMHPADFLTLYPKQDNEETYGHFLHINRKLIKYPHMMDAAIDQLNSQLTSRLSMLTKKDTDSLAACLKTAAMFYADIICFDGDVEPAAGLPIYLNESEEPV